MKLKEVLEMIFKSGERVVKVSNGDYSDLVWSSDWNAGICAFNESRRVRWIKDDVDCALIEVRVWETN